MAAIPISISGVLYDKHARTQQSVYLIGSAQIVGLSVGGGPIVPPEESVPPDPPSGAHPAFPIWGPPGTDFPDKPGYPTIPFPPDFPKPPEPPVTKPPPDDGGWGYHEDWGWVYKPKPGVDPTPKS